MAEYFPEIKKIEYEGIGTDNPFAFRHYQPSAVVMGKTMEEHLRFAVCYWHTFRGNGSDPFGMPTLIRPWLNDSNPLKQAEHTLDAAFEFITKLGVKYWCFHDRDIAPEGSTLQETNQNLDHIIQLAARKQEESGLKLLWGTANLFSHPRFMAGAGTNPDPKIFAMAATQIKKALDSTHLLNGEGYVFWGGREGYDTLLNTDMAAETEHLARLLQMAVDYKKSIGFKGVFYIEPKPQEPTKHQYDYDAQSCHAFLQKFGLADEFKLNIEANHATLAGHEFQHELDYAAANNLFGSVDANRGDMLCGWDTDQFPTDLYQATMAMFSILKAGGFTTGGLNFDAKVRRQSIDPIDLFHAHIGSMDAFAFGLKAAAMLIEEGTIDRVRETRYAGWKSPLGKQILDSGSTLADLEKWCLENPEASPVSGRQELIENRINDVIVRTMKAEN